MRVVPVDAYQLNEGRSPRRGTNGRKSAARAVAAIRYVVRHRLRHSRNAIAHPHGRRGFRAPAGRLAIAARPRRLHAKPRHHRAALRERPRRSLRDAALMPGRRPDSPPGLPHRLRRRAQLPEPQRPTRRSRHSRRKCAAVAPGIGARKAPATPVWNGTSTPRARPGSMARQSRGPPTTRASRAQRLLFAPLPRYARGSPFSPRFRASRASRTPRQRLQPG